MRPYGCRCGGNTRHGPLAPDLTRSTTFAMPDAETLRAVGAGELPGEFYPRYGHPAARRFESLVADLEGADGAVSFASGMAALHGIFATFLGAGDTIACSREVYGGTIAMLREDLPRFGVTVRPFDPFAPDSFDEAFAGAKLVHIESPTNPLCRVVDLEALVDKARGHGALVSVDATFLPPPLQRPLQLGVDLVMHSATKFLGGHSDAMGGVVSGRHNMLEPMERFRRRTGAMLAPDTAWLLGRSLATLELRARAAARSAAKLADRLDTMRQNGCPVKVVHYPGLADHADHPIARRQMALFGSMLAFEVAGGIEDAVWVYDRFQAFTRAPSLGGIESLACLPLHTSHAMATPEERKKAGISDGLIRLSVGIEPVDLLEADLLQALTDE